MKILMVTPYITSSAHPQFLKNQTGLGYMVHDIAESIAKNNSVDVFTLSALTPSMTIEGFNILGRNWWKIATSIRMDRIKDFMSFINKYSIPLKGKMRTLYYYCAMGQIERIVSNYDIVHIHGCSPITDACINICKRKKTPVLITLHGLISFEECIQLSPSMKQYERDFLKQSLMEQNK